MGAGTAPAENPHRQPEPGHAPGSLRRAARRLVDQAYLQGIVVVAAGNNMGLPSYPAVFASLVAVDNQSFPEPTTFEFHTGRQLEVVARGAFMSVPKSGGGYQLWTGTSFACPHVTGLVARLLSLNPCSRLFRSRHFCTRLARESDTRRP